MVVGYGWPACRATRGVGWGWWVGLGVTVGLVGAMLLSHGCRGRGDAVSTVGSLDMYIVAADPQGHPMRVTRSVGGGKVLGDASSAPVKGVPCHGTAGEHGGWGWEVAEVSRMTVRDTDLRCFGLSLSPRCHVWRTLTRGRLMRLFVCSSAADYRSSSSAWADA